MLNSVFEQIVGVGIIKKLKAEERNHRNTLRLREPQFVANNNLPIKCVIYRTLSRSVVVRWVVYDIYFRKNKKL